MLSKSILSILVLSAAVLVSCSDHANRFNPVISSGKSRKDFDDFTLVDSKQVHLLESTLQRFLAKIAIPVNGTIILKSEDRNDVQLSIRRICESVRRSLARFAADCELTSTVRTYEQSLNDVPLSEDWFSELLLQSAIIFRDLGNAINEIAAALRWQFSIGNATVIGSQQLTIQTDSFQFLGMVYNAADYGENLFKCLMQTTEGKGHKAPSTISQALLNLAKHPLKIALRTFKSNMNNVSLDEAVRSRQKQKYWHVILCLTLTNGEGSYENCIEELRTLDKCLIDLQQRSNNRSRSVVDSKVWVKAIERLSDRKIRTDKRGEVEVSLVSVRKAPTTMEQNVRYVFERMLGKKIPRKSPLHRATADLSDTLSSTRWGCRFVDELCQYLAIDEDGQNKLRRQSTKDKTATARRREIAEALHTYRKGLLMRTFNTIDKMHHSASVMEGFLVKGIKDILNEAWQSHLNVLSSLIDWMTKLLETYNGESASESELSSSDTSSADHQGDEYASSDFEDSSEHSVATRSTRVTLKEADASMKNLLESMENVSRYRTANNDTTLTSLANNLLLITMFTETIGFISTLYCFDCVRNNEQNRLDFNDQWKRARRSLPFPLPFDYEQMIDRISRNRLVVEYNKHSLISISDEND